MNSLLWPLNVWTRVPWSKTIKLSLFKNNAVFMSVFSLGGCVMSMWHWPVDVLIRENSKHIYANFVSLSAITKCHLGIISTQPDGVTSTVISTYVLVIQASWLFKPRPYNKVIDRYPSIKTIVPGHAHTVHIVITLNFFSASCFLDYFQSWIFHFLDYFQW